MPHDDPIKKFKDAQREGWALFAPLAAFTTPAACSLVDFARVRKGEAVLDVACGTGVVAVTAARQGAQVCGLDLSPVLLEDARRSSDLLSLNIEFREGDVEALPYRDQQFDVVLSQFGHMFAPRWEVALAEMLRVLRPGGRIAFSTWPPHLVIGRIFSTVSGHLPLPEGVAPPPAWGDPETVRQRLGDRVTNLEFHSDEMMIPALSPRHFRAGLERTAGPVIKAVEALAHEPVRLAKLRNELDAIAETFFWKNRVRQTYLLTRAVKT